MKTLSYRDCRREGQVLVEGFGEDWYQPHFAGWTGVLPTSPGEGRGCTEAQRGDASQEQQNVQRD